jgi:hypothetical protein
MNDLVFWIVLSCARFKSFTIITLKDFLMAQLNTFINNDNKCLDNNILHKYNYNHKFNYLKTKWVLILIIYNSNNIINNLNALVF